MVRSLDQYIHKSKEGERAGGSGGRSDVLETRPGPPFALLDEADYDADARPDIFEKTLPDLLGPRLIGFSVG